MMQCGQHNITEWAPHRYHISSTASINPLMTNRIDHSPFPSSVATLASCCSTSLVQSATERPEEVLLTIHE
ncbi:hypothetical protein BC827DRAFT_1171626 [Russula dissimulans]|nr:hypothetical protein BC827DRAFT_1171626 [Russula dissimulans]